MLAKNILRIKKGPWQILKENEQNGARGSGKQSPAKNIKWELRVYPTIVLRAIVLEVDKLPWLLHIEPGNPMSVELNSSPDLY